MKQYYVCVVVFMIFLLFLMCWDNPRSLSTNDISEIKNGRKFILYWNKFFGDADFSIGFGADRFEKCLYKNCFTTNNKALLPVEEFDAILFHGYDYNSWRAFDGRPAKRKPRQVYIFFVMESPQIIPNHYKREHDFYNWTLTYRKDSDIFRPYGRFHKVSTDFKMPTVEEIRNRPKKIAWFVSNCEAPSQRQELVRELSIYLPVDIYGKCGPLRCDIDDEACFKMLETDYKFYLSFENSICTDYVTEKLFSTMKLNIVPIVLGGANYSLDAPQHSVIDVMAFRDISSLVDHIRFLDENPEDYLKYFEWKKSYNVRRCYMWDELCELCRKLNEDHEPKTYKSVSDWWSGRNEDHCDNTFVNDFIGNK